MNERTKEKKVEEFVIKAGLNKYGFIHIPKKARASLPFDVGEPLKARIESEELVVTKEE